MWNEFKIIEEVPENELENFAHYLPHRAVLNLKSKTTPVRPVFDASAKEKSSPSLNECLEKGPNLLELIPDVVTRFRLHRIGVVADIAKAFLQIGVREQDRDFLRFLWWEDPWAIQKKLKIFRHRRVVFGVSSSPFLLGATINFHLEKAPEEYGVTAKKLKTSLYVDNCVTSVDDEQQLYKFKEEANYLMRSAKFELRGWTWNQISQEEVEDVPVLGLKWNLKEDTLSLDLDGFEFSHGPVTKRRILSAAHRVYDPIGVSCPVTLGPKTLLQETWELKAGWDEELPDGITKKFQDWIEQLVWLKKIKFPRWLFGVCCEKENWSLHCFADASKDAYAACIFMRGKSEGRVTVQLVLAKTRVAPKKVTIPRLELLACTIAVRLADSVKKMLDFPDIPTRYWTDSMNALSWIKKEDIWGTFVANRVKEIRSQSGSENWSHVPGLDNPADLPSRGCSAKKLMESSWWEGPEWLKKSDDCWPKSRSRPDEEVVRSERRKTIATNLSLTEETNNKKSIQKKTKILESLQKKTNRYSKIVRIVAYMHRFCHNCKSAVRKRKKDAVTVAEMEKAESTIFKLIHDVSYPREEDENLTRLNAFRDKAGIWRVKTKIAMREDLYSFRFPIVLPGQHSLVRAMIFEEHKMLSHAGVQCLQSALREKFWIEKGRKTVREVIKTCGRCRRFDAKKLQSVPAPLPENRVRDAAVFEIVGIDLAGPLILKNGQKSWIVLFTCAVFRAVHLELVTSLSTEAFLQAFRRFVARRGRPTTIYTDNGTNFQGAEHLFQTLNWKIISEFVGVRRINWIFNPPTAAWWGGWFERVVQMVKRILRRVLGKAALDAEEMMTILCDSESIINSRPLTYVSEDAEDLVPLSPSMFLQEIRDVGVPDMDQIDEKGANRRLQYRQRLREDLRIRFRKEYLGTLISNVSKKVRGASIKVGDVVLIEVDNQKRVTWPLAKVMEVFPGRDGIVRLVRVKTQKGELKRPIQRIYPMELSEENRKTVLLKEPASQPKEPEKPPEEIVTRSGRKVKIPEKLSY